MRLTLTRGRGVILVVALVCAGLVAALAVSKLDRRDAGEVARHRERVERRSERGAAAPTGSTTPESAPDEMDDPGACPPGSACEVHEISCQGAPGSQPVFLSIGAAEAAPRGVIVLFSGGDGDKWWADSPHAQAFLARLHDAGFETVQVRWRDGWLAAEDPVSPAATACRSAEVVRLVHASRYAALDIDPEVGRCGYCVTGNSGGASQIAYGLAFYDLDEIVDAAVLTSGPPHAALRQGCEMQPAEQPYWYDRSTQADIDAAFGVVGRDGPCRSGDPAFVDDLDEASIDGGGSEYSHPSTRIHFIFGERDKTVAPAHALRYLDVLRRAGSPLVSEETITRMGHLVQRSPEALEALFRALTL